MADALVELIRCPTADAARARSRTLLSAGIVATARRDGDEHVVCVPADQGAQAAAVLGVAEPVAGAPAAVASSDDGAPPAPVVAVEDSVFAPAPDPVRPAPIDAPDAAESAADDLAAADPDAAEPDAAEPAGPVVETVFGAATGSPPSEPGPDTASATTETVFGPAAITADSTVGLGAAPAPAPAHRGVAVAGDVVAAAAVSSTGTGTAVAAVADAAPAKPPPEIDARGYAVIALVESDAEARVLAAELLEAGIGVDLTDAVEAGYADADHGAGSLVVRILPSDIERAARVVGVDPPRRISIIEGTQPATVDGEEVRDYLGGRVQLTRRQAITMMIGYAVALLVIPLLVFWGTRALLDPGIESPEIPRPAYLPDAPSE